MSHVDETTSNATPPLSRFTGIKLAFLAAAGASLVLSVSLWFSGNHESGLFVAVWVPTILGLGTLTLVGERDALR